MTWVGDVYLPLISDVNFSASREVDERRFITQRNTVTEFEHSLEQGSIPFWIVSGEHPNGRSLTEQREAIISLKRKNAPLNPVTIEGANMHLSISDEQVPREPSQQILSGDITARSLPDTEYIPGVDNKYRFIDNDIGYKFYSLAGLSPTVGSVNFVHPEEWNTSSISPTTTESTADGDVDFYQTANINDTNSSISEGSSVTRSFNKVGGDYDIYVRVKGASAGNVVEIEGDKYSLTDNHETIKLRKTASTGASLGVTVKATNGTVDLDYVWIDAKHNGGIICEYPSNNYKEPQQRAVVKALDSSGDRAYTKSHDFGTNPEITNSMLRFNGLSMDYYGTSWSSLGDIEFELNGTTYNTINTVQISEINPQHVRFGYEINGTVQFIDLHRHSYTAKLTLYDVDTVRVNDSATYSISGNRITSGSGHFLLKPKKEGTLSTSSSSMEVNGLNPDTETEIILGHDGFDWRTTLTYGHEPEVYVRP